MLEDVVAEGEWVEKGQTNREDVGTSGSRRKPETHIRAKASRLGEKSDITFQPARINNSTYVKKAKRTNNA